MSSRLANYLVVVFSYPVLRNALRCTLPEKTHFDISQTYPTKKYSICLLIPLSTPTRTRLTIGADGQHVFHDMRFWKIFEAYHAWL